MKYSYEFKKMCVEMYRQGRIPDVPNGISRKNFKNRISIWKKIEDIHGPEALKHKAANKNWSAEEKFEIISKVFAGEAKKIVAINAGISVGLLYQWLSKYELYGYNGLIPRKKGRKSKNPMKKIEVIRPLELNESEYEELIRLRAENEYMKAEIEVIKKEIALREEREAARLKVKKQRLSRNSEKKDIN